jgi:PhnB protein
MSVSHKPAGYATVTPYLIIDGAADAIDYYREAFGAEELFRMPEPAPGGAAGRNRIGHAEIRIGDSPIMLADEHPEMDLLGPTSRGGATASLMIYTEDADAMFARALAAGATQERAVQDQFYGDRSGTLVDPFGHRWTIATHVEDVAPEIMQERMGALVVKPIQPA